MGYEENCFKYDAKILFQQEHLSNSVHRLNFSSLTGENLEEYNSVVVAAAVESSSVVIESSANVEAAGAVSEAPDASAQGVGLARVGVGAAVTTAHGVEVQRTRLIKFLANIVG